YCDCPSGISGDMFLGALLDGGLPVEVLSAQLEKLHLPGFQGVSVSKVRRGAIQASLLNLAIADPDQDHEDETHHHRHLAEILDLLAGSGLPEEVVRTAAAVFQKLAEAEAKVHGTSIEEVHFHEVGAVDSILDIAGAAAGLQAMGIQQVYASSLPLGSGSVRTQHGILPLPAPATLELLRAAHAPVVPSPAEVELVTPTGAAILSALARFEQPAMTIQAVGIGAGRRDLEWPNVLRVVIGEVEAVPGQHVELETNLDDMNPQILGFVMSRLFEAGALDVFFTPIQMKKTRPATRLSVIARREDEPALANILLRETSTLGVRVHPIYRYEAARETRRIATRYGEAVVKLKIVDGEILQANPEYEDCVRLAEASRRPIMEIYAEISEQARHILG
ncbi:MAG TPA: nickel pincer cofactor biosynthesis protein LarC, partial [Anaerolineaceae bacterium]